MLAELVFIYLLNSTVPLYHPQLDGTVPHYSLKQDKQLELHVRAPLTPRLALDLRPYVTWGGSVIGTAGAKLELSIRVVDGFSVGYYHHSSHNLDRGGDMLKSDGVIVRWQLN